MARRRDERVDIAVLAAVRQLLAEVGYARLTMEALAARAGTSKPAIRRRWISLRHVVVDAMADAQAGVVKPNTGCLTCDLIEHLEALDEALEDASMGLVLPQLIADLADDPGLRADFLDRFWAPRRAACLTTLRLGLERGQLREGLDTELVIDAVAGPLLLRHLFGHAGTDRDTHRRLIDTLLSGLAPAGAHHHRDHVCGETTSDRA
jgi:AcrR family transcriptional regulator